MHLIRLPKICQEIESSELKAQQQLNDDIAIIGKSHRATKFGSRF